MDLSDIVYRDKFVLCTDPVNYEQQYDEAKVRELTFFLINLSKEYGHLYID